LNTLKGTRFNRARRGRESSKVDIYSEAFRDFKENLEKLRKLYPVKTICMHGSPLSKWDNRDLWTKYDYRDFGIIGEPYFDVDFHEVFYLTDTGRRWGGDSVSVRDKVEGHPSVIRSAVNSSISRGKEVGDLRFRHTWDIIAAAERGLLPDKMMINTHPQRWDDRAWPWVRPSEPLLRRMPSACFTG